MQLNIVRIEVNPEEAELFKNFRKYQDDFVEMLENGVFDFKKGIAYIYRNDKGVITDINIMENKFKRKKKK